MRIVLHRNFDGVGYAQGVAGGLCGGRRCHVRALRRFGSPPNHRSPRVGGVIGWSAADFCGGRLPAYGTDACGNREFSYGPDSCHRRAVEYTALGPVARRVWACG
jgi:hypothetical protein